MLSYIYGKIASLRNTLYDTSVFEVFDVGVRVISVGNITTGGTGKTPLVAYIAEILADRGEIVCILTRGYGRRDAKKRVLVSDGKQVLADAEHAGDEPFELAGKLLGKAIIIADRDRVSAAEWAGRRFGVTTFVLDDGFQHRQVKRDLDIVCIDATRPNGHTQAGSLRSGRMLPVGRLREPLMGLRRADAIVITRANLVEDISGLKSEISDLIGGVPIFSARNKIRGIVSLEDFPAKSRRLQREEDKERKAFGFCSIGNGDSFFEQLRRDDFTLLGTKAHRDHHLYTQSDIREIARLAGDSGADILMTTAKDAVKLSNLKFEMPVFVVEIEMVIDEADGFNAMV